MTYLTVCQLMRRCGARASAIYTIPNEELCFGVRSQSLYVSAGVHMMVVAMKMSVVFRLGK